MVEKLKKIDCCWRCNKNNGCAPEKVCKIDKPNLADCSQCAGYKDGVPCPQFVPKKEWQFDMKKCPDCNRIQKMPKLPGDVCENKDCESEVVAYHYKGNKTTNFAALHDNKPMWTNPNWD